MSLHLTVQGVPVLPFVVGSLNDSHIREHPVGRASVDDDRYEIVDESLGRIAGKIPALDQTAVPVVRAKMHVLQDVSLGHRMAMQGILKVLHGHRTFLSLEDDVHVYLYHIN